MTRTTFFFGVLMLLVVPAQALAAGPSSFVGSISLWVAITVGTLTALIVVYHANRLGPSVLRQVYLFFAAGMLVIVFGITVVTVPPWTSQATIMQIHDAMFILGFALMAGGAGKLMHAAGKR